MKNQNQTQLDTDQIMKKKFDESLDADRVILVGGEKLELSIDSDKIANAVKEGLKTVYFNAPKQETKEHYSAPQIIEKNVFIPKIERIEVPIIRTEYKTIEIPVITEKIIYVDKPIIVKEYEIREIVKERYYPLIMKISALVQAICVTGLLLINLLKK